MRRFSRKSHGCANAHDFNLSRRYYFTDRSSEAPLALPKTTKGTESYERGTIARYHCKDGYSLSSFHGQEIYRCLSNGEWSPKVPPVCISTDFNNIDGTKIDPLISCGHA